MTRNQRASNAERKLREDIVRQLTTINKLKASTDGSSSLSAISRRPKPSSATTPSCTKKKWRRDSKARCSLQNGLASSALPLSDLGIVVQHHAQQ